MIWPRLITALLTTPVTVFVMTCVTALMLLLSSTFLYANTHPNQDLQLVGQGKMHWLWFDLYEARFYNTKGRYQPEYYPQALSLRYLRAIKQPQLLEATFSEWQRLGIQWRPQWEQQLTNYWPSVKKGDELAIRVEPNGSSQFYFNDTPLVTIKDPAFGPAFLAIWLSSNSQDARLTRQLKGQ